MGFIYTLTSPSRKEYVGQTTRSIEQRLDEHQKEYSVCKAIAGAIRKHGWDNFIVDYYECPDDELNKHETWLIRLMGTLSPNGYNLREGGGSRGKFSEETKQRLSDSRMGEKNHRYGTKWSKQTKEKIVSKWTIEKRQERSMVYSGAGNPLYGKPRDEDTIEKLKNAWTDDKKMKMSLQKSGENNPMFGVRGEKHPWYGRTHTTESIEKNKNSQPNSKKIDKYDLQGNYICSYNSCREAARCLNKDTHASINRCVNGDQKTSYGFIWKESIN